MTETETKMTTDEFWATVAEMGWGTKTTDTKKLKRFLMRKGKEFCKEFERVYGGSGAPRCGLRPLRR
jgi:hypothetical protein